MQYFDLHCDTLTKACRLGGSLYDGKIAAGMGDGQYLEKWQQCYAIWLDDSIHGEAAFSSFLRYARFYRSEISRMNHMGISNLTPHLTVENGVSLAGDIRNMEHFCRNSVEMIGLTWNGANELGGGVNEPGGLTPFGVEVVKEAERLGIIVDAAHLSEEAFRDLCRVAKKPFAVSHCGCYDLRHHRRNLKKWQIKEVIDRGGIIGICFYPAFLPKRRSAIEGVKDCLDYIVSLGGENNIALGSDFDGAKMSRELSGVRDIRFLVNDRLYRNAEAFFATNYRCRP